MRQILKPSKDRSSTWMWFPVLFYSPIEDFFLSRWTSQAARSCSCSFLNCLLLMRRAWTYCYCKCPSNTCRMLLNHHFISTAAEWRCIFLHSSGHTPPSVTHYAVSCTCDKSTKLAIGPPRYPKSFPTRLLLSQLIT